MNLMICTVLVALVVGLRWLRGVAKKEAAVGFGGVQDFHDAEEQGTFRLLTIGVLFFCLLGFFLLCVFAVYL